MMRTIFFIVIFILAFLSTLLYSVALKRFKKSSLLVAEYIRTYAFFASTVLWALSSIKWYLGSDDISLYQSFWDIMPATFYHYIPLIVVLGVVFPILFYAVFYVLIKDLGQKIINWCVSVEVCLLVFDFLLFGTISNKNFTVLFIICIVISIIIAFVDKRVLDFYTFGKYLNWLKSRWALFFLICFINMFYYPNELYLSNIEGFFNSYVSFVIILFLGTIFSFLFLSLLLFILPKNWIDICVSVVFAMGVGCYIQGMFLNGKLATMQGTPEVWPMWTNVINILIWCVLIVGVTLLGHFKKKTIQVYEYVSIFMILVLVATNVTFIVQKQGELVSNHKGLTSEGAMVLGEDNNVVMFILDMTDVKVLEQIIEENSSFIDPLNDFTFYSNCSSVFSHTDSAMSYILTGTKWSDDNEDIYSTYAYSENDTFLKKLYSAGVRLGIYTSSDYISEDYYSMLENYSENIEQDSIVSNTISTMWRTSMYRAAPFSFKINYYYYSDNIEGMTDIGDRWSMDNDIFFHNMIKSNGLSVAEGALGTFNLYHMRGSHYPYYLSDDITLDNSHTEVSVYSQTRGAMKIVYEYIDELKKLGLYDDTTIIITADHGAANNTRSCYDETKNQMNGTCMPILLVKMPDQHGDVLTYNPAPVYHGNMLSTVLDIYGLEYDKLEPRLCDIREGDNVIRYFYDDTVSPAIKVRVIGDAHDVNNWIAED